MLNQQKKKLDTYLRLLQANLKQLEREVKMIWKSCTHFVYKAKKQLLHR